MGNAMSDSFFFFFCFSIFFPFISFLFRSMSRQNVSSGRRLQCRTLYAFSAQSLACGKSDLIHFKGRAAAEGKSQLLRCSGKNKTRNVWRIFSLGILEVLRRRKKNSNGKSATTLFAFPSPPPKKHRKRIPSYSSLGLVRGKHNLE